MCLAILVYMQVCVHPEGCASAPVRSDRPFREGKELQLSTLVLRPFWWPMNMKEMPSMEASPHTMAGSSSPALSPCSSTNLHMPHPTHHPGWLGATNADGRCCQRHSATPQLQLWRDTMAASSCHCSSTGAAEIAGVEFAASRASIADPFKLQRDQGTENHVTGRAGVRFLLVADVEGDVEKGGPIWMSGYL